MSSQRDSHSHTIVQSSNESLPTDKTIVYDYRDLPSTSVEQHDARSAYPLHEAWSAYEPSSYRISTTSSSTSIEIASSGTIYTFSTGTHESYSIRSFFVHFSPLSNTKLSPFQRDFTAQPLGTRPRCQGCVALYQTFPTGHAGFGMVFCVFIGLLGALQISNPIVCNDAQHAPPRYT